MDINIIDIILILTVLINLILTLSIIVRLNPVLGVFHRKPELSIGESAPTFQLEFLSNESIQLRTLLNQGFTIAFVFLSPHCALCKHHIPDLKKFQHIAEATEKIKFIYVIDASKIIAEAEATKTGLDINRTIAKQYNTNKFVSFYNPTRAHPHYCLIDRDGIVISRGNLGHPDWIAKIKLWNEQLYSD